MEAKTAVSKPEAQKEINEWLDYKGVRRRKRETNEESIEELVEAIEDGYLRFDPDTKHLILTLGVPLGENGDISELSFKPRLTVGEMRPYLKKIKSGDTDGRVMAYVQALTGKPEKVIESLDTNDQATAVLITLFFL